MEVAGQGGRAAAKVNDFIGCHHDQVCYGNRNSIARGITTFVIDDAFGQAHLSAMLPKSEILTKLEEAAPSKADIALVSAPAFAQTKF